MKHSIPPCTARISQGNLHVVHTLTSRSRSGAGAVTDFMRQLCTAKDRQFSGPDARQPAKTFKHNQITILETTQRAVDRSTSSMSSLGLITGTAMAPPTVRGEAEALQGTSTMGLPRALRAWEGGSGHGHRLSSDVPLWAGRSGAGPDLRLVFEKAGYEALIPEAIRDSGDCAGATNP